MGEASKAGVRFRRLWRSWCLKGDLKERQRCQAAVGQTGRGWQGEAQFQVFGCKQEMLDPMDSIFKRFSEISNSSQNGITGNNKKTAKAPERTYETWRS